MTVAEVEELRLKQVSGEKMPKIKANCDSNYEIDAHEAGMFHVYLEVEDWIKGKKLSKGNVRKFHKNDFLAMSKSVNNRGDKGRPRNAFSDYDVVKVIHDPIADKKLSNAINFDSDSNEIPLEKLNREQLEGRYFDLSGELDPDVSDDELRALIVKAISASL